MKKLLRTLIGHGHNFATRCWVMTVVAVWWFGRLAGKHEELRSEISRLNSELFSLGLICIAVILLAGYGRTFYPNDVKKIFDRSREKERIRQLSKMYVILYLVLFPLIYLRYRAIDGIGGELVALGIVCLLVLLPLEAERSLRFRYIGTAYGKDPVNLERIWKKMMMVWHVVLLSALAAGTYFQYVTASRF